MITGKDPLDPLARLGPFVRVEDKVYFGLLGGFSEDVGSFGGIAIFDLKTQKWQMIHHPLLLNSFVTGIVIDQGGTLWLGTLVHGEYGEYPASGLVTYNIKSQKWKSYTTKNSKISGDLIHLVKYIPPYIWVGTEFGMDRICENTWKSFKWQPGKEDMQFVLSEVKN